MDQIVKHLPAMWETRVQSLGWEDSLEKDMATHFSILAWRIPWTEVDCHSQCCKESDMTETTEHAHMPARISFNLGIPEVSLFSSVLLSQKKSLKMSDSLSLGLLKSSQYFVDRLICAMLDSTYK